MIDELDMPDFTGQEVNTKVNINIGCLFDYPTGTIVKGRRGESIINGGLMPITGVSGFGNTFKSTILHYMSLSALNTIMATTKSFIHTYDTESNITHNRLDALADNFEHLPKYITSPELRTWQLVSKTDVSGDVWAKKLSKYLQGKAANKKDLVKLEAFTDRFTGKELTIHVPTFVEIDSFTEFEAAATVDTLLEDLQSGSATSAAVTQGGFKTKYLSTIPPLANQSNTYFLLTAHMGTKVDMNASKYTPTPKKRLNALKSGEDFKGAGAKYSFLTNNAWAADGVSVLKNQTTKLPEYPKGNDKIEADLNLVKLSQLRGKGGQTGIIIGIIVSQLEGVLSELSQFHFIKEHGRFGLNGNLVNYSLDLLPDVKLSRTTIRPKIDSDPKLRRVIGITSDMLQLDIFHSHILEMDGIWCTPKELYDDIIALGYDWDVLLKTRSYWTIDQYSNKVPFLSTVDLLRMRRKLYFPYFLNEDMTLKKEYIQ